MEKNIFENDWWEDAYPSSYPPAINYRNHQKSLAYFNHLAPLVLFVFTTRQSQKGVAWHNAPALEYVLVSTFRPIKVLMVDFSKKGFHKERSSLFVTRPLISPRPFYRLQPA